MSATWNKLSIIRIKSTFESKKFKIFSGLSPKFKLTDKLY